MAPLKAETEEQGAAQPEETSMFTGGLGERLSAVVRGLTEVLEEAARLAEAE